MGNQSKMTAFRVYRETLTLSGKTSLAQVQADFGANSGRFSQ